MPDRAGVVAPEEAIGTGDRKALKAEILGDGTHAGPENAREMEAAEGVRTDDQRGRVDVDDRPFPDGLEQAHDVPAPETEAPVRKGSADEVFPVGAVDVDAALPGVDPRPSVDALLQPLEAQDAGKDQVVLEGAVPVEAGVRPPFENAAGRGTGTDLVPHPVDTERRPERVLPVAVAEPGGR